MPVSIQGLEWHNRGLTICGGGMRVPTSSRPDPILGRLQNAIHIQQKYGFRLGAGFGCD
jgi:hypothetical protein